MSAVTLLNPHLRPSDVELIGNDHGQRSLDALAGFRVLGDDRERIVGMNRDVGIGCGWRTDRSELTLELDTGIQAEHDAASGQRRHLEKGSTIDV